MGSRSRRACFHAPRTSLSVGNADVSRRLGLRMAPGWPISAFGLSVSGLPDATGDPKRTVAAGSLNDEREKDRALLFVGPPSCDAIMANDDETTKIPVSYVNLAFPPMSSSEFNGLISGKVVAKLSMHFDENKICRDKSL